MATAAERREWQAYLELKQRVMSQTEPEKDESDSEKAKRVKMLLSNFPKFCAYYFPHYMSSPFGWFHKRAAKAILKDPNIFAVLEWPREHAKSVFVDVFMPLYLLAKGELTGMMLASYTEPKAKSLLSDIQAELSSNRRFAADFGQQKTLGKWSDGHFITSTGIGFWAFGLGQNPAGTRNAGNRPNYGVLDDVDSKDLAKNQERVQGAVDWILGEFFGALSIQGARMIYANNRIHKAGITAHIVGDVKAGDPKREGIYHSKVFAFEHGRTRNEASPENGKPAWKERYTPEMLIEKMQKMGYRNAQRQFFHRHIEEGNVFKPEHIQWIKPLPFKKYDALVSYCDPSFKGTKKNDYKAIVLCGAKGKYIDVLRVFLKQTSVSSMVKAHFDLHELTSETNARHYIEANFIQDMFIQDYELEEEVRGYPMPIIPDKRSKPEKTGRIGKLDSLFERGLIRFSEAERKDVNMQVLIDQLLGFPHAHDDGPDAMEGSIYYLNLTQRARIFNPRQGKYRQSNRRRV